MISPVMLKGNKSGIRVIISPEADIQTILCCLTDKLNATGKYYTNIKPITVCFEGKQLTEDEKIQILDTLRMKGINIGEHPAVSETGNLAGKKYKPITSKQLYTDKNGLFYVGNLRNGQSITAVASIVIVGDVEAGAYVESAGNVVVIGNAHGIIKTGCMGRTDTFMYSLNKD